MFGLGESSNGAKKALSQSARACRSARPAGDDPKSLPSGDDIAKTAAASASLLFMDDTGSVLVVCCALESAPGLHTKQPPALARTAQTTRPWRVFRNFPIIQYIFPIIPYGGCLFQLFHPAVAFSRFSQLSRFSRFSRFARFARFSRFSRHRAARQRNGGACAAEGDGGRFGRSQPGHVDRRPSERAELRNCRDFDGAAPHTGGAAFAPLQRGQHTR